MTSMEMLGQVANLQEYLGVVPNKPQEPAHSWVFRGHRELDWQPLPKIDRAEYSLYRGDQGWDRVEHERWLLKEFMKAARPHLPIDPQDTWEWLGTAQHHGLATRLLDWTANPLIALFFAVEKPNDNRDSVVWSYLHKGKSSTSYKDPFEIPELVFFDPPHMSLRIPAQAGCFTALPGGDSGNYATWPGSVARIEVLGRMRAEIRKQLLNLGITRGSLFPDLDGIATHVSRRFMRAQS